MELAKISSRGVVLDKGLFGYPIMKERDNGYNCELDKHYIGALLYRKWTGTKMMFAIQNIYGSDGLQIMLTEDEMEWLLDNRKNIDKLWSPGTTSSGLPKSPDFQEYLRFSKQSMNRHVMARLVSYKNLTLQKEFQRFRLQVYVRNPAGIYIPRNEYGFKFSCTQQVWQQLSLVMEDAIDYCCSAEHDRDMGESHRLALACAEDEEPVPTPQITNMVQNVSTF